MKILLTTIFKDDSEYDRIERMLQTFMPFMSGLCVALTGTSKKYDKLIKLIESYKGQYVITTPESNPQIYLRVDDEYIFANFAEARNVCFQLATEMQKTTEYDWWTWADADDVLINGQELQDCAKKAKELSIDLVFFTYWYSIKMRDGKFTREDVQIDHLRERLIRPNFFKWVSRLHEIALPMDGNYQPKNTVYDYNPQENRNLVWAHITDDERVLSAMNRNIKILEKQVEEEEHKDPRTVFYLAKTYFDMANMGKKELYQLCDLLLDEYLEKSGWAEERSNAWEYKGKIRMNTGNHQDAIRCFHQAIAQFGNRHMPYLLLAKEYAEINDHEQAEFWLDLSLRMNPPQTRTTIGSPLEVKVLAASLKVNEAIRKQQIEEAINWLKTRNNLLGITDDPMLKSLEDARLLNEAAKWVFNYAKWLKDTNNHNKIPHLLDSLPFDLGREAFAHFIANDFSTPKVWGKKEIAYVASWGVEHFEGWSGKSLNSGIGGSETAVIELAKRWVKQGYSVTVYGDPREDEGVIDGVIYKPWYTINWKDTFNILILWRSPHLLDREITARKIYMDLHDVSSQLDWTDKRMEKVDKVFFKSEAHRKMIPKLPDTKAVIISNGI